jgi:hypothetical protein
VDRQRSFRHLPFVTGIVPLVIIFFIIPFSSSVQARNFNVHSAFSVGRDAILTRAKTWLEPQVPYNQRGWYQGYREDCSGFVSMAWGLPTSLTTYTLATVADPITKDELQPGDVLNNANGGGNPNLAHVLIFESWVDSSHTSYNAYEENPYWNGAHYTTNIPYPFWPGYDTSGYIPMRLKTLSNAPAITPASTPSIPVPVPAPTQPSTPTSTSIKPGGMWISPGDNFTVMQGQTVQLSAHAYPTNSGDLAIAYVQFTAYWSGINSSMWPVLQRVYPTSGTDIFSYTWDLTYQGSPIPQGL